MDLVTVTDVRTPSSRAELSFGPGERPMGGGTWLYSEAQPGLTGLVDLTSLGWSPLDETPDGVTVGATCTIAELTRLRARPEWAAAPLIRQCAESLLASFKIWNVATVGGNVALGLPAGAMTSLMSTLDATAVVWTSDGGERRTPVAEFVTGVRESALAPGEVLRALEIPTASLESRTAFRRIALSPLGRSGTLVTGRLAEAGEFVVTVTAGTIRPVQLRFDEVPSERALSAALDGVDEWYDDPHGAPDWRRATSTGFAEEIRRELGGSW
ncbi:FAD binding domain-containing protein [Frigoribacterium sp. CFBP9039]|uniref:FAD binding domain-containing protein n=1 Tax=unclassified Frigoribacterium TaxID=2627005 RepID=UPI002A6A2F6B|nr:MULTISPECIES: FAD binding domain-containing protein [unclassified Frigoribacterium]MDY0892366.1 FAD binding domain-containing protein [Frigoribacterium sp. CFBP9030]MDY0946845.1 FAD binding domain-containing protein [Frigoribacterium sp. CFBP9039]